MKTTDQNVNDRQIRTGHSPSQGMMILEVTRDAKVNGKQVKAGDTIKVTRSEARRFFSTDKTLYRVLLG